MHNQIWQPITGLEINLVTCQVCFYYSLPVLNGLMDQQFLSHYMLLVQSIYILSISEEQINQCTMLLIKFVGMFGVLYGDRHMNANIHHLLHLTDCEGPGSTLGLKITIHVFP